MAVQLQQIHSQAQHNIHEYEKVIWVNKLLITSTVCEPSWAATSRHISRERSFDFEDASNLASNGFAAIFFQFKPHSTLASTCHKA